MGLVSDAKTLYSTKKTTKNTDLFINAYIINSYPANKLPRSYYTTNLI